MSGISSLRAVAAINYGTFIPTNHNSVFFIEAREELSSSAAPSVRRSTRHLPEQTDDSSGPSRGEIKQKPFKSNSIMMPIHIPYVI